MLCNIVSSVAKEWFDINPINHIVDSCPLTTLTDDGLIPFSAADSVFTWLRGVLIKAQKRPR